MQKLKLLIGATFIAVAVLSWTFFAGSKSLKIVDNNSVPEFWGGCGFDCDPNPWPGCESMQNCSKYNGKPTSCAIYWYRTKQKSGRQRMSGWDGANLYNFGQCALLFDCAYDTQSSTCNQNAQVGTPSWYLSCQETT